MLNWCSLIHGIINGREMEFRNLICRIWIANSREFCLPLSVFKHRKLPESFRSSKFHLFIIYECEREAFVREKYYDAVAMELCRTQMSSSPFGLRVAQITINICFHTRHSTIELSQTLPSHLKQPLKRARMFYVKDTRRERLQVLHGTMSAWAFHIHASLFMEWRGSRLFHGLGKYCFNESIVEGFV